MTQNTKKPAKWRSEMTDAERRKIAALKAKRDTAAGEYNSELARVKNRCVQALRRKAEKEAKQ